jgi:hypothetical protein
MLSFPEKEVRAMRLLLPLVLVTTIVIASGCGVDYKAEVQSDTSWSGAFGNRTVDGRGNKTVDLPDEHPQCCVVQKQTEQGYLRVRVKAEGGMWLFGPDDSDWAETRAEYGVVSVCSKD